MLVEGLRRRIFQYIAAKVLSRVGTMWMAATLIFLCFF